MFGKLFKHEFNKSKTSLFALWLTTLISGVVGFFIMWLICYTIESAQDYAVLLVFASMTLMGVLFVIFGCTVASGIVLLVQFYRHKFTDEGYLTFTLPVTTHQILLSSILNLALWQLIMVLTTVLAAFVLFLPMIIYANSNIDFSIFSGLSFADIYGTSIPGVGISSIISGISGYLYNLIMPLLCITIGCQIAKKHKILASFGIYYALTMVISIIGSVLSAMAAMGGFALIPSADGVYIFTYVVTAILYLAIAVGGYFVMHNLLDKRLNLT